MGEIVNETDLVNFLGKNHNARYATDVLTNEIRDRESSPLFKYAKNNDGQVITQYFMEDVEAMGLLKMDFLGLKNLTMIEKKLGQKKV